MRVVLIAVLLLQILVAEPLLAASHTHGMAAPGAYTTGAPQVHKANGPVNTQAHEHNGGEHDTCHTQDRCCCVLAGHCSPSAVTASTSPNPSPTPEAYAPARLLAMLAYGFPSRPHRPPPRSSR
ncbi:hypothetical protein [Salinisphaera sp. S4-8]|jgi:hypothetical protein|uniref:hypothetical protein n=1 Tax=Salinisphaera sp. S4-8 TaxID=633357 RepID=UPI0033423B9C